MNAQKPLTALLTAAGAALVAAGPAHSRDADEAHAATAKPCHYALEKQVDRRVRMSDVHGWKGVTATFQYAADHSADTYVGVSIQTPAGHWQANGTDHVTNANVFGQTASVVGRGDKA